MAYKFINGKMIITPAPFSPEKTFDCGQSFRFFKAERNGVTGYEGIASGKFCRVEEDSGILILTGISENDAEFWSDYFSLSDNYSLIKSDILAKTGKYSEHFNKCLKSGDGIRILKQDGWESIATFILSQNNNIPRITNLVKRISEMFGEKIENEYGTFYSFPTPTSLYEAGIDKIAESKCGFRAKYLFDAAEKIVSGEIDLSVIPSLSTEEAIEYLCRIKGVGIKVASCALLFGFKKYDAFPVDVWMKKVIDTRFDGKMPDLGKYKGIAQQFLFYYERYNGN